MRIGLGFDIHRLSGVAAESQGKRMVLGGVRVPKAPNVIAASDSDILFHALYDALAGAGGISNRRSGAGRSSKRATKELVSKLRAKGFKICNLDIVVVIERPRLKKWLPAIRRQIALALGINKTKIGLKAKSKEGLDAVGSGEAIAVTCVVLLGGAGHDN